MTTMDSLEVSRSQRTLRARRVSETLEQLQGRGTFGHLDLGKARVGRITHRIHGHHERAYRFVLDFDADAVTIPSLLPATLSPSLHRELRCVLRPILSNGLKEHIRVDPEKGELRVFQNRGLLTLSITVRNDAYEYCTDQLIRLADEVLAALLREQRESTSAGRVASMDRRSLERASSTLS